MTLAVMLFCEQIANMETVGVIIEEIFLNILTIKRRKSKGAIVVVRAQSKY